MRTSIRLLTLAPAFLAAGCSVAPVMNPTAKIGMGLFEPGQQPVKSEAAEVISRHNRYLMAQQHFEKSFDEYLRDLDATMEQLSQGGTTSDVPVDGIPYYYIRHVAQLGRSHLAKARAYMEQGDLARAERSAFNGIKLVDERCLFNDICIAEVGEEGWGLLVEIYKRMELPGSEIWARNQWKLKKDYLVSPDGLAAYSELHAMRKEGSDQLGESNQFIRELNAQKAEQTLNRFAAAAAAAGSAVASYQEATIRAQASRQGYMSSNQMAAIQMAQMNRTMSNMMLMSTINKTGSWGNNLAIVHSLANPQMFKQFTDPNAGFQTREIMAEFAQRAQQLGRGNLAVAQRAAALAGLNSNLDKARRSGTQQEKQEAYEKFMPAYAELSMELRKMK